MAVTSDLTLSEIQAKITDSSLATYVGNMSALPSGITVSEFLAKFLQACAVAQVAKNAANSTAVAGELLNSYPLPNTGTVQTNVANNIQYFNATYSISVVVAAGLDTSSPTYA